MKDKNFVILLSLLVIVAVIFVLGIIFQDQIFKTAISKVTLSDQVDKNNRVVESKTSFLDNIGSIYAEVKVSYGKSDTKVKAEWFLMLNGKEEDIAPSASEQIVTGTRPVLFKITKPATASVWKTGTYKVKIIFNGKENEVKQFSVSASAAATPTVTVTK